VGENSIVYMDDFTTADDTHNGPPGSQLIMRRMSTVNDVRYHFRLPDAPEPDPQSPSPLAVLAPGEGVWRACFSPALNPSYIDPAIRVEWEDSVI